MDYSDNPDVPATMRRAARPKEGLWWNVTANTMQGKSVVRKWAQRRLKIALLSALARKGWNGRGMVKAKREVMLNDRDGVNVPGENGEAKKKEKERGDLVGTLQVHALPKIMQATGVEVKKEAEILIAIVGRKVEGARRGSESSGNKERHSSIVKARR